ncbi:integrase core domain-containing protein [Achromobacter sp.]|uniref:integrase core domain-containing protein n=1 Tax=Achromobacter sp. TaxID=134375 RepID=UPI003919B9FB
MRIRNTINCNKWVSAGAACAQQAASYPRGIKLDHTRPGKPPDDGHIESFNGRLRDEYPNVQEFITLHHKRKTRQDGLWFIYRQRLSEISLNSSSVITHPLPLPQETRLNL